jgi:protein-tyrosine-phosphatase
MTQSHLSCILKLSEKLEKVPEARLLSEFSGGETSISDPFGGGADVYEECFSQMKEHLCCLYDKIDRKL